MKQDEEELLLRQEEVQENVGFQMPSAADYHFKDGVSHKRDHSVALHHSLPPLSGSSICQATMLNPIFGVPSLLSTSNSLASSVGFYHLSLGHVLLTLLVQEVELETDFQSLPLSQHL